MKNNLIPFFITGETIEIISEKQLNYNVNYSHTIFFLILTKMYSMDLGETFALFPEVS